MHPESIPARAVKPAQPALYGKVASRMRVGGMPPGLHKRFQKNPADATSSPPPRQFDPHRYFLAPTFYPRKLWGRPHRCSPTVSGFMFYSKRLPGAPHPGRDQTTRCTNQSGTSYRFYTGFHLPQRLILCRILFITDSLCNFYAWFHKYQQRPVRGRGRPNIPTLQPIPPEGALFHYMDLCWFDLHLFV